MSITELLGIVGRAYERAKCILTRESFLVVCIVLHDVSILDM